MTTKRCRGFTFIEILIVMIFIGLLSAIAVPRFRLYKEKAYLSTMREDLGHLRIAEEEYFAEHQVYSTDTSSLDAHASSRVIIDLTSVDPIGGYSAVASHLSLPGQSCVTRSGADAVGVVSGAIICGPSPSGSGTLGGPTP